MSVEFSSYNYVFCANICKEIPFMAYSHNLFILDFDHYFTFSVVRSFFLNHTLTGRLLEINFAVCKLLLVELHPDGMHC